jgi:predicted CoA-substrate-specific enzyme activase
MRYSLGIDIGSTTVKVVLLKDGVQIAQDYQRHFSQVREKAAEMVAAVAPLIGNEEVAIAISGSAGLGLSSAIGAPFVQEVFATTQVVRTLAPDASCVIELGGEDAKIIFFDRAGVDERMNGSCAGGTGAFIDQMATLLDVSADELDLMSMQATRTYPIASRCGVFAKTDLQPLLNQGARKEDLAKSIYLSVVHQTIAGLAQGRKIIGKVLFLGGPLYFCRGLRECFCEALGLSQEGSDSENIAVFPEYARYSVAMGAAFYAMTTDLTFTVSDFLERVKNAQVGKSVDRLPPLFESQADYQAFAQRHSRATLAQSLITDYRGDAYLGIDCGSTTTKLVLLTDDHKILYEYYASNRGNPVAIVKEQLEQIYSLCGDRIRIRASAVTGYGEELIRNAFGVDFGVVETIAHYRAASYFQPNVDFILDIGGQDIKCFKIRNGAIDSIMLNEACSSGCGSFLETFARSMGYTIAEFANRGLQSTAPVNLGSRCTVFMNSSVKQSQKDGASVEDISAGLSISVVKNAIYKVIRASSAAELGEHIVVQGGTFYNDAVLRAFELDLGRDVIRPAIAGLMGAFGAALYAQDLQKEESTLISPTDLQAFTHTARSAVCGRCTNRCHLTVNTFGSGKKFISGNRCEKGLGLTKQREPMPNVYAYKRDYLTSLAAQNPQKEGMPHIGLPLALGNYELLPLWHAIFTYLGCRVTISPMSTRETYTQGQFSIPSDTACYPAKIMHGHITQLLEEGVDAIFYPALTYNVNEHDSDNHFNCPVVAYYSELLSKNMEDLQKTNFLYPYLNINDDARLAKGLYASLSHWIPSLTLSQMKKAVKAGRRAQKTYYESVRAEGERAIAFARARGKRIMVLSGRPYHIDAEICHGIDALANSLGFAVISEDCISHLTKTPPVQVLNQWTYHARLYRAASYVCTQRDMELVQLVSFGCGVDAITTDEVRRILEKGGKYYTQLKIDEITNLGAVKIRLRSLLGALEQKERTQA